MEGTAKMSILLAHILYKQLFLRGCTLFRVISCVTKECWSASQLMSMLAVEAQTSLTDKCQKIWFPPSLENEKFKRPEGVLPGSDFKRGSVSDEVMHPPSWGQASLPVVSSHNRPINQTTTLWVMEDKTSPGILPTVMWTRARKGQQSGRKQCSLHGLRIT